MGSGEPLRPALLLQAPSHCSRRQREAWRTRCSRHPPLFGHWSRGLYTGLTSYEGSTWKWNGASNWNGGGLHYSENYGYGTVNALNAGAWLRSGACVSDRRHVSLRLVAKGADISGTNRICLRATRTQASAGARTGSWTCSARILWPIWRSASATEITSAYF